jgi:hypothetical protein
MKNLNSTLQLEAGTAAACELRLFLCTLQLRSGSSSGWLDAHGEGYSQSYMLLPSSSTSSYRVRD